MPVYQGNWVEKPFTRSTNLWGYLLPIDRIWIFAKYVSLAFLCPFLFLWEFFFFPFFCSLPIANAKFSLSVFSRLYMSSWLSGHANFAGYMSRGKRAHQKKTHIYRGFLCECVCASFFFSSFYFLSNFFSSLYLKTQRDADTVKLSQLLFSFFFVDMDFSIWDNKRQGWCSYIYWYASVWPLANPSSCSFERNEHLCFLIFFSSSSFCTQQNSSLSWIEKDFLFSYYFHFYPKIEACSRKIRIRGRKYINVLFFFYFVCTCICFFFWKKKNIIQKISYLRWRNFLLIFFFFFYQKIIKSNGWKNIL